MAEELFDFGVVLIRLRAGKRVQRTGWNGKGMWLALVPASAPIGIMMYIACVREYIMMYTAQRDFVPWLASQTDILANDWREV